MKSEIRKVGEGDYTADAGNGVPADLVSRLLDDPAFPLADPNTRIVKDGDTTLVAKTEWSLGGAIIPVAYKCVRRLTWLKRLTQMMGANRTWRTYQAGQRLEELGIPTARPLLILVPNRGRPGSPTWIAHEWLDGTRHLGELVREYGRTDGEWRLDELARLLGTVLGELHRAGGTHRDLKPENIMARLSEGKGSGVWLIDLDGLRFRRWIGEGRRRRDLSRLAVGVEEASGVRWTVRLRFLRGYLTARGDQGRWKQQWRSLRRATQRRMRQRAGRVGRTRQERDGK